MNDQKVSPRYVLAILAAVIFTWITHEFAHWIVSVSLGYDSIMTLNGVQSTSNGESPSEIHGALISASGPVVTVVQGISVFYMIRSRDWNKYLYPFLFGAFYMRFVAAQMNIINPNDEGRISAFFGLGTFTLPIIVSAFLFFLVYKISRKYELNWKFQVATALPVVVFSSIWILADQFFRIRIL